MVKRNRIYLKAGFILKPEGTYASMAVGGQHLIRDVWNVVNATEGENSALLVNFADGIGIGELTVSVAGSGPKMIWETIDQEATYSLTFGLKKRYYTNTRYRRYKSFGWLSWVWVRKVGWNHNKIKHKTPGLHKEKMLVSISILWEMSALRNIQLSVPSPDEWCGLFKTEKKTLWECLARSPWDSYPGTGDKSTERQISTLAEEPAFCKLEHSGAEPPWPVVTAMLAGSAEAEWSFVRDAGEGVQAHSRGHMTQDPCQAWVWVTISRTALNDSSGLGWPVQAHLLPIPVSAFGPCVTPLELNAAIREPLENWSELPWLVLLCRRVTKHPDGQFHAQGRMSWWLQSLY